MRNLICSIALFLSFVAGTHGQSAEPAASHMRAAEDLLAAMDMEQVFNQGMETMLQSQIKADPSLKQFEDIMRSFTRKYLKWSELRSDYAKIYMDVFSEEELRQMLEFYQTPLGKKMLRTLPDLLAKGTRLSNDRLQPHLPELEQQIVERLTQQKQGKPEADQPRPQQP